MIRLRSTAEPGRGAMTSSDALKQSGTPLDPCQRAGRENTRLRHKYMAFPSSVCAPAVPTRQSSGSATTQRQEPPPWVAPLHRPPPAGVPGPLRPTAILLHHRVKSKSTGFRRSGHFSSPDGPRDERLGAGCGAAVRRCCATLRPRAETAS
ncbi:unnamed protein product [Arctogadus glacialis]